MLLLRQSTAVTVKLGPFVDETDGKTAETALTISQADVRLSKNGGNMAQKNESSACTHDELGVYDCPLDTTDTGTLGRLQIFVHESGALPVWHEFMVLPAFVYDALIGGTDYLQVDAVQIEGGDATSAIYDQVEAVTGNGGQSLNQIPWNSDWDAEIESEVTDALTAYAPATSSALATVDTVVDAIKAKTDNLPADPADDSDIDAQLAAIAGYVDTEIAAIKAVTDKLDDTLEDDGGTYRFTTNALEQGPAGSGLDAAGVRDAVGLASANLDTQLDGLSTQIDGISTEAGAGAIEHTVTITVNEIPVSGADVWVTSTDDIDDAVVASGETDGNGQVTFYLDAGTYYVWAQKSGLNITNPTVIEVSE